MGLLLGTELEVAVRSGTDATGTGDDVNLTQQ